MIAISQTDYIDFISKSGMSRLSKVRSLFERENYQPAFDFYKNLRDEFVDFIKAGKHKTELFVFNEKQPKKKQARYESLIRGYLKFLGRKKISYFDPPTASWKHKDLSIKMNPEVGIDINGQKYIVKLYFKDSPLNRGHVKILLRMMQTTLATGIYEGYKCALLDVEKGKLHYSKNEEPIIDELIKGEAESFIAIWQGLEKSAA